MGQAGCAAAAEDGVLGAASSCEAGCTAAGARDINALFCFKETKEIAEFVCHWTVRGTHHHVLILFHVLCACVLFHVLCSDARLWCSYVAARKMHALLLLT